MLALVPAGFLVLVLLAALAVDSAVAYLGRQQLHDALSAAANDAVTAGLNDASFYRAGSLALDPAAAARTVCAAVAAQGDGTLHGITVSMAVEGDTIRLIGAATVDAVFGTAIPGFGHREVRASAQATLQSGPATPAGPVSAGFGPAVPLRCGPGPGPLPGGAAGS
ncbi:MAG TPA: hypothetical protein VFN68_05260 [Acidimicrobiales bacterium]|nr:hypothetical protein [Acidimicrobiales bacterium]